MITFSANLQALLASPVTESFHLVKIGPRAGSSTVFLKTNYYRDLIFNGDTYLSDGMLLGIDLPRLSSTVDRNIFKITFADPTMSFGSWAESGAVGTPVKVYIGFVDQTTKQPVLTSPEVLMIYAGRVDTTSYMLNTASDGEAGFGIACSSPMSDLDLTMRYVVSNSYMEDNYPGDVSYEQVYEGAGPVNLRWGKL
jgi:hypothetical protein